MNKSAVKSSNILIGRRKSIYSTISETSSNNNNSHLLNYINQHQLLNDATVTSGKIYGLLSWSGEAISVQVCETDNGDVLLIPIEKRFSVFPVNCLYIEKDGSNVTTKKELTLELYDGDIELTGHSFNENELVTIKAANIHTYILENGKIIRDIIFTTNKNNKVVLTGLSSKS